VWAMMRILERHGKAKTTQASRPEEEQEECLYESPTKSAEFPSIGRTDAKEEGLDIIRSGGEKKSWAKLSQRERGGGLESSWKTQRFESQY